MEDKPVKATLYLGWPRHKPARMYAQELGKIPKPERPALMALVPEEIRPLVERHLNLMENRNVRR